MELCLELLFLLPSAPQCCDSGCAPLYLVYVLLKMEPRASCMLTSVLPNELHPWPSAAGVNSGSKSTELQDIKLYVARQGQKAVLNKKDSSHVVHI